MELRTKLGGTGPSQWLVPLFLLVGVLAPTACVLWFMNEAARSQAEAARRGVTDAYRGQLRLLRDRVDSYWEKRAAALQEQAGAGAPADFLRAVTSGLADSVLLLRSDGTTAYPASVSSLTPNPLSDRLDFRAAELLEERSAWAAAAAAYARIARAEKEPSIIAQAAQAQVRSLVRGGDKDGALRTIGEYFVSGPAAGGDDGQGRLIAADEQLLTLHLLPPADRRYSAALRRLVAMLNDYQRVSMPSAQRLFLMEQARSASPGAVFPTLAAERLAAQFLEADSTRSSEPVLQRSRVPDVWKLPSKDGRVLALYSSGTVIAAMQGLLDPQNSSVRFEVIQPGASAPGESISAGPLLPGWQIAFSLTDTRPMDELARRRMASYLWVGFLVIAAMAISGLILGQSFRKQLRLAHLKTDLVAAVSHELKTPLASMRLLVDSLLDDAELDPRKTRDYLQLIAGENLRLARLIENFLTFSRIERRRQSFEFTDIRPADVVESAVQVMRERIQNPSCRLEVEIASNLPPLHADPDALVTVLLNLLDNAYKYTPAAKRIALHAYREDGHVIFAVEDNGIGIPSREQKRIFRKFYQVDQRLARETGGCGLGLSIVDFIVRAHGGAIRVTSRTGSGSTFRVLLPCREF